MILCAGLLPGAARAAGAVPAGVEAETGGARALRTMLTQRLDSDLAYFHNVVALKDHGGPIGGMAGNYVSEVARAEANLPLLEKYAKDKDALGPGHYIPVPPHRELSSTDSTQAYANLVLLLNLAAAREANDNKSVIAFGQKISPTPHDLPESTRGPGLDPAKVYREMYLALAFANLNEGNDEEAVRWFSELGPKGDLQRLREELDAAAKAAKEKEARLSKLRTKSLAVIPFVVDNESIKWMRTGLADVVTADVVKFSDLSVLERSQLSAVLTEAKLAQLGVTEAKDLEELGKLTQAGTLLVGTVNLLPDGSAQVTVRLVDAESTTLLAVATGKTPMDKAVDEARQLAINVLSEVGFIDPATEAAARAAKGPSSQSVRDLEQARLLMSTKADEAKALYAKAMREDPAYAKQFKDLQAEFKDISAKVAVMPFTNASGASEDAWMVRGVSEALESDLPKMHFAVVERGQLRTLLQQAALSQAIDTAGAQELGKKLNADFAVVGSILHQKPALRVDARFVDVRTGGIMFAASAENRNDDLLALLVDLDKEIAKSLHERLTSETIESLAAKKMSQADFEKFVRGELAKDALARDTTPAATGGTDGSANKSHVPVTGIVLAAVGAVAATASFLIANAHNTNAAYYAGLASLSTAGDTKSSFTASETSEFHQAIGWNVGGAVGLVLTAVGAGLVTFDLVHNRAPAHPDAPPAPATPTPDSSAGRPQ
jgi:TolB-like protein